MANGDAKASTSKAVHSHSKKPLAELEPDSDDDDNDDDEDSDDDAEVDENFRNELLAALQADGVADEFDAAEENDESEEELLDDEQMMALDDKLADIFRLQGGGKKGKKGAFRIPIAAEDLLTQFLFPSRANRRPSLPPPRRRPHRISRQVAFRQPPPRPRPPPPLQHRPRFRHSRAGAPIQGRQAPSPNRVRPQGLARA